MELLDNTYNLKIVLKQWKSFVSKKVITVTYKS
jgi:hypothetical protein